LFYVKIWKYPWSLKMSHRKNLVKQFGLVIFAVVLAGCQTNAYNAPSMATAERPLQTSPQGRLNAPPQSGAVERYADHLFDGPAGQDFLGALSMGYRELARERDSASDFTDAAKFLQRAGAAARGERIWPEEIIARVLPHYALQDLVYARSRLMRIFDQGADQRMPRVAARAQVAFDCWMESQEENRYPEYVHRCRQTFEDAMSQIEVRPTGAPAERKSTPAPQCGGEACRPLSLYFDLNSDRLSANELERLRNWVAQAKASGTSIVLAAHTDRSASDQYNEGLAKRRLDHVLGLLAEMGIGRERIVQARAYGERQPPVPTADGVVEARNRVVEVWLFTR
jgi:outer membrane protein OmpA-like peptidoglycan-associated protein